MRTEEIGEILNISMSAGATAISELVDKEVKITVTSVDEVLAGSFSLSEYEPTICFDYEFTGGVTDKSLVVMRNSDVAALVGAVLQKEFTDGFELDEVNKTAASQIATDFLNGLFKSLSTFANISIAVSEVEPFMAPETEPLLKEYYNADQNICSVKLGIMVNGLIDSEFVILLNDQQAENLIGTFNKGVAETEEPEVPENAEAPKEPTTEYAEAPSSYDIRPVELQRYSEDEEPDISEQSSNLNMLMNVPLQITVEIGRAKMQIKDILDLTNGSIVELNKQAGSHVDVFVNGQPIASGEVVVVDDYYGVRISEILNNGEIMKIL